MHIVVITHIAGALAYILAAGLLAGTRAQHRYKFLLLGACAVTAVWEALAASASLINPSGHWLAAAITASEQLRLLAWVAVAGFVLFVAYKKRWQQGVAGVGGALLLVASAYVIGIEIYGAGAVSPEVLRAAYIARVAIAVAALLLVENLYRNSGRDARWAVKYLCFGLGIIFAYDFFLYADAALVDEIDGRFYAARGLIDAMAIPLIIVAAARSKSWPIDLHVSRQMVFHSATLLAAGAYLVVMAAVGYSLQLIDTPWGTVAQAAFLTAALVILAAVLTSGKAQAALRNFISQNFFTFKYDYRREWLRFIAATSDSLTELSVPERVVRALANFVESTGGAVWVREEEGSYRLGGSWNMNGLPVVLGAGEPLFDSLKASGGIVDIGARLVDGANAPAFPYPDWLTGHARAQFILPLMHGESLEGVVVLSRPRADRKLDWEDFELLKTAGRQAASYLAEANAVRSLNQARRFEEFNRQFAFVAHDIKNLAGQMTLLLQNAEVHGDNPQFQKDMLHTIGHSVTRMRAMLDQLRKGVVSASRAATPFNLTDVLRRISASWQLQIPALSVDMAEDAILVVGDPDRLDVVINHLLQNALDATSGKGHVALELHIEGTRTNGGAGSAAEETWAVITISDNGPGMDRKFIEEKLFEPLSNSTKSGGFGIGAFQARQSIRDMGGRLDVDSRIDVGTRMLVRLPIARKLAAVSETPRRAEASALLLRSGRIA